ncbi:winged helix-turn-helix domain-containing protein, partial [Porphyromonas loveana]|uniref:winged helix-turn-helix domain-containing protein n=1 Tax=Porphyromonas loveana TaxID=1884669 RepID=UPI00359F3F00
MIPDFQTLMLPFLKCVSDGKEYKVRDVLERLATEFAVTNEERKELLSSGTQAIFDNRVGWAKAHLKKAGLLDSPRRAMVVITDLGRQVLSERISRIDTRYLRRFPSYLEFQKASRNDNETEEEATDAENNMQTPEENLDKAYQRIRRSLASQLL